MKLKKIIFVSIFLLITLSLGSVYASDYQTSDLDSVGDMNNIQSETSDDILTNEIETLTIDDVKLKTSNENIVEREESSLEDTATGESETHAINESDVTVNASNVFKGQNATIYVTAPEATGTTNITIGNKTYTPEFISGVATQIISEYDIGINNVTVKYNDIVKETSFKVLDGVITNETFKDYFEVVQFDYELVSCIPEGATLDFRGNVFIETIPGKAQDLIINTPINLVSSTNDAVIDYRSKIYVSYNAIGSNISNIKFNQLVVRTTSKIINSTINSLKFNALSSVILNSTIYNFEPGGSNLFIYNSTFKSDLLFASDQHYNPFHNLTIKNCFIEGNVEIRYGSDCLIDNNTISGGNLKINAANTIVKNNIITSMSTTWAVIIDDTSSIMINNLVVNNTLFSSKYCGNSAVNDVGKGRYHHIIENNTPKNQLMVDMRVNQSVFYDEEVILIVDVDAEGNVTIDVNGEKSVVKLVNHTVTYIINNYVLGSNKIIVTYGDVINEWGTNQTTFDVKKVEFCPVGLIFNNGTAGKVSSVNVVLPDDANGTIVLAIKDNVSTLAIKQDANGSQNIINVPPLFEGNYSITANFSSVKYVNNFTSDIICFTKEITPTPSSKVVLKAVKKTIAVKKSAKNLVLKATLKINGKAKKGLKVTFKFNGKSYIGKTDKNGAVKVTIKKSVIKKLKAGKKYVAIMKYAKETAKITVKVKK